MYMYEQFKFIVMNSQKRVAAGGWGGGYILFRRYKVGYGFVPIRVGELFRFPLSRHFNRLTMMLLHADIYNPFYQMLFLESCP